jgi:hypothetical protein
MAIVFKIRRSDGLFSMGGANPNFNKVGKIWKQKGHLTSHLTCVADGGWKGTKPYDESLMVVGKAPNHTMNVKSCSTN